uniref:Monoxygenase, putative n=1 Tax=Arundo donax TaxID=35708 RepID=A0A0A9F7K2_ARUDO
MSPEDALRHKSMNPEEFVMSVNRALDFGYGPHPHSGTLDHYSIFLIQRMLNQFRFYTMSLVRNMIPTSIIFMTKSI